LPLKRIRETDAAPDGSNGETDATPDGSRDESTVPEAEELQEPDEAPIAAEPGSPDRAAVEGGPEKVSRGPIARRRRSHRTSKVWIALAALAAVAFIVWRIVGASTGSGSTAQYTASQAEKGMLRVTVDGSGFVYATKTAAVSPRVTGTVSGLRVSVGSVVRTGDVLFHVVNEDLESAKAQALAAYRKAKQGVYQAELALIEAKQQLDKLQDAQDSPNPPSDEDIEEAEMRVDSANEGLMAAKESRSADYAAYEKAVQDSNSRTVRSPINGVVSAVNVSNGDSVSGGGSSSGGQSGSGGTSSSGSGSSGSSGASSSSGSTGSSTAPVVVTHMQSMYAKITVNEVDVSSVRRGQKVTVTFDALPDLTVTGKVSRVSPSGNNNSGVVTFDVEISFDVQNSRVKPGMTASASIVTALARNAVLVPNSAVQTSDGQSYVRVLANASGTGTPEQVTVVTGLANDTMTQIKSGLNGHEYVVTGQRMEQTTSSGGSGFSFPGMGGQMRSTTRSSGSGSGSGTRSTGSGTNSGSGSSGGAPSGPPQ